MAFFSNSLESRYSVSELSSPFEVAAAQHEKARPSQEPQPMRTFREPWALAARGSEVEGSVSDTAAVYLANL